MIQKEIINNAKLLIGQRFLHSSNSDLGNDCIGVVYKSVINLLTIEQKDYFNDLLLNRRFIKSNFIESLSCDNILFTKINKPKVSDIAVYSFREFPLHFAIISNLTPLTIIHSSSLIGCVVENCIDDYWSSRFFCYLRFLF